MYAKRLTFPSVHLRLSPLSKFKFSLSEIQIITRMQLDLVHMSNHNPFNSIKQSLLLQLFPD